MITPSLQQIAAMPFPASLMAVRSHYDPHWGRSESGEARRFKVDVGVTMTIYEHHSFEVTACSQEEAEDVAREEVGALCGNADEFDVNELRVVDASCDHSTPLLGTAA